MSLSLYNRLMGQYLKFAFFIAALASQASANLTAVIDTAKVEARVDDVSTELGQMRDLIAAPRTGDEQDYAVSNKAQILFNQRIPATKFSVKVPLHPWEQEQNIPETPASIDRMIKNSEQRLRESPPPDPELCQTFQQAETMKDQGRINYDQKNALDENQMGVYRYLKNGGLGSVEINEALALIATVVGDAFVFSTVVHEAVGHAMDPNLSSEGVIAGEVYAFKMQYLWLKAIDPSGTRLALLRGKLMQMQKNHPSKLVKMALDYTASLDVLVGTGGDKGKIRQYVIDLDYQEGQEHDGKRGGTSPVSA